MFRRLCDISGSENIASKAHGRSNVVLFSRTNLDVLICARMYEPTLKVRTNRDVKETCRKSVIHVTKQLICRAYRHVAHLIRLVLQYNANKCVLNRRLN